MAEWYRVTVTIPHDNGLPQDAAQNTFAFRVAGTADRVLVAADINARLDGFYTTLASHFSSQMNLAAISTKVYDMLDDVPRYPFVETTLTVTGASTSGNDMPSEVAVCLSFQGAVESGVNMRRRRGRVYIGPLQWTSADQPLVQAGVFNAIVTAADNYLLHPVSGLSDWAVYSPYTHHGIPVGERLTPEDPEIPDALPASFTPVAKFWVDDAWDTQRRRGVQATSRTVVNV